MVTYVVDGLVIEVLGGNGSLDDLLQDLLAELLGRDVRGVLSGNDDSVDTLRNDSTAILLVLDGDLGLGVGAEPRERSVTTSGRHSGVQLVGKHEGKGEELRGLISGIAEHDALVTGTELLESLIVVKTLGDIGGLLLNGNKQVASLVVKALLGVIVADVLDGIPDHLLVVDVSSGRDLAKDHDHASLGSGLAGDLGQRVLSQAGIEDGIRNLVGNLVGVTLTNRLGLVEEKCRLATGMDTLAGSRGGS